MGTDAETTTRPTTPPQPEDTNGFDLRARALAEIAKLTDEDLETFQSATKKLISARKLAANRQNAQKSTGPRTPEGKAQSRRNALKHGIFARKVFATTEDEAIANEAFDDMLMDLWEHYVPVGPIEEMLVEKAAADHWSLAMAIEETLCARKEDLDRALRYRTTLERSLYRTLGELEGRQSVRQQEEEEAL